MKKLSGGIDIGSEYHHIIIMDDEQKILYDKKIAHRFSEFYQAIKEFKGIKEREKAIIPFAIEGKNGYGAPFDRILDIDIPSIEVATLITMALGVPFTPS